MEQGRLLIAVGLSFLVFFLWQFFFVENQPIQPSQPVVESQTPAPQTSTIEETPSMSVPSSELIAQSLSQPSVPVIERSKMITVTTPLYEAKISETGALFRSFILKHYREAVAKDSPLKELIAEDNLTGNVGLSFFGNSVHQFDNVPFVTASGIDTVDATSTSVPVSFLWKSPDGIVVEKKYVFNPNSYVIDLSVTIRNGSQQPLAGNLTLSLIDKFESSRQYGFVGPSGFVNDRLNQVKLKKIKDQNSFDGKIEWIAMQGRYFMSSIISGEPVTGKMKLVERNDDWIQNLMIRPDVNIQPGMQQVFSYQVFMGPKSMDVLKTVDHSLDKAINFGMFDFIAKPCLWMMNKLYSVIPNYGIAIIVLTILIKILLWPLGTKSYKSMNDMKKLQPLMTEIREKYKNDRSKMNEEMMGLYKIYKINPMGGCFPMVVQIPVFFALYRMLYEAIELRHAPFMGWINDLAAPDRLFHFGFSIPFMEPPYGIPVLTIVMGATMFLQQKMSPAPGDPNQAKMMMLMPIFFTVIFINFSSGLVLYWLVNNILSIAQQYYISKKYA